MAQKQQVTTATGNIAAGIGASLCRLDVIAAYPITPQSPVVEYLADLVYNGKIDARMIQVESEHAAMAVCQGAASVPGRVFTATSAQGLALMYEPYFSQATLRLPMVMTIASREMTAPETIWSGQQDTMSVRNSGWMHVYVENNQEILDMVIQGYRIGEDKDILLPVLVSYDGFYLSHFTERLEVPQQEDVDRFLPRYEPDHVIFDPEHSLCLSPITPGNLFIEYRRSHFAALDRAFEKIDQVDDEYAKIFGRRWGGLIEEYRCDDAEIVILTIGSMTGTAKVAVDAARERGIKVGLIKVRFMRPFPGKRIAKVLANKKAWASLDRSVEFGWGCGPIYMETKAAYGVPVSSFSAIGGLGGADINLSDVTKVIEALDATKDTEGQKETLWLTKPITI